MAFYFRQIKLRSSYGSNMLRPTIGSPAWFDFQPNLARRDRWEKSQQFFPQFSHNVEFRSDHCHQPQNCVFPLAQTWMATLLKFHDFFCFLVDMRCHMGENKSAMCTTSAPTSTTPNRETCRFEAPPTRRPKATRLSIRTVQAQGYAYSDKPL